MKPTARWWFSNTDSSLYMRASSESEHSEETRGDEAFGKNIQIMINIYICGCEFVLTGVNEELIGNSWVVHIVDGCSKQSCQDLQVSENSLMDEI